MQAMGMLGCGSHFESRKTGNIMLNKRLAEACVSC
jgi:hypothetical protein